ADNATTGELVAASSWSFDYNGDTVIDPGPTETITAGDVLGSMNNYYGGQLTFNQDINPGASGGTANIVLTIEHADVDLAYAQLGHGGYDSDTGGNGTINAVGDIRAVARTGGMTFLAGTDNQTYVQVGHGGYETEGSNQGNIFLRAAGDVTLVGGTGGDIDNDKRIYAQIGHGGWGAETTLAVGHEGAIKVSSGSGALFTSLGTGKFDDVFDFDLDGNTDEVTFGADVSVNGVTVQGGVGQFVNGADVNDDDNSAQIGHGGRSATGNHTGDIGVSATKDISVLGGSGYRSFAQIGHGGLAASGNLSGGISVISEGGDLTVKAGPAVGGINVVEAYALVGHGDDRNSNTNNATGTRFGEIFALADTITLDRSGNDIAWIGHTFDMAANQGDPFSNSSNALQTPTDNLGGGMQVIARGGLNYLNEGALLGNGSISINNSFRDNYITPNLQNGDFTYSGNNLIINTLLDSTTSFATTAAQANNLTFIASGDIDANFKIQNPGAGDVNLIAGASIAASSIVDRPSMTGGVSGTDLNFQQIDHLWCPPVGFINIQSIKTDGSQFGNTGTLAGTLSTAAVSTAANGGSTTLTGFGLDPGSVSITVGGVTITDDGNGNLVDAGGTLGAPGNIVGTVDYVRGTVTFTFDADPADANDAVASFDSTTGDVHIDASPRQIAIGSRDGGTNVMGNGVYVIGGNSTDEYAQIGFHSINATDDLGMVDALNGNATGAIMVSAKEGGVRLEAGNQTRAVAQIGHGGDDSTAGFSSVVSDDPTHSGMIVVNAQYGATAGDISLVAGVDTADPFDRDQQWVMIGHGGRAINGDHNGTIDVLGGNILIQAGGQNTGMTDSFAQIGHGGTSSDGAFDGAITVDATGTVTLAAGGGQNAIAHIGHGGVGSDGNKNGKVSVMAAGDITLTAGLGTLDALGGAAGVNRSAQIGHGGNNTTGDYSGLVNIVSGGSISLTGGDTNDSYVQIGHGGDDAKGDMSGGTQVLAAGDITATGGTGARTYAQIGAGG
ncbi:MAG: hypothetical protein KDM91_22930, partial [Verrucomicrobiae bacterium]|nr:hypothetical protein [Verrucomicrobiae bacterium]